MADQPNKSPTPTADPERAGTAPVDPTNLTRGVDAERMQSGADVAADAAGAEGVGPADPIGGDAIKAARHGRVRSRIRMAGDVGLL